jgi:superfamily I DNA/RNA helicase
MTTHPPTLEQSAILDAVAATPTNLMIRAYAGCGKTSTLELIDAAIPGPTLLVCFNKAIAATAAKRFRTTTQVRTFNSLGHRIWAAAISSKVTFNPQKILEIFRSLVDEAPKSDRGELWANWDSIRQGVDLARALGYIPIGHAKAEKSLCTAYQVLDLLDEAPTDLATYYIDTILTTSISQSYRGIIDFADQCYMPALFSGTYPRFPAVLVDEYQDLSPVNHEIVRKLTKSSRQIGVGDEAQAIYGFRGATSSSMADATSRYAMDIYPLSVSFRCPSRIVSNVHWRVPDFKAFRVGGTVLHAKALAHDSATILCRNNAPLLARAMTLLKLGRSVDVSGIDLAAKLLKTMAKLGPESMTSAQTLSSIDNWEAAKLANDSKSAKDFAACMRVFARQGTLDVAMAYAKHLFDQSGTVKFSTGHKAKGLEWDHVYHLDPQLLNSRGQDPNVRYVIDTRARESLTYLDSIDVPT